MNVTNIIDRLDIIARDIDGLGHVPESRLESIRSQIEDIQVALDKIVDDFGDEDIRGDDCYD